MVEQLSTRGLRTRFLLGRATLAIAALLIAPFARAESPVTLRFVVWDGDEALRILRSEVKQFEAAHPNVKVRLESVDYKIYFQKLLTQYAANTAPDVAMMDPQNMQQFARRGAFADLSGPIRETPGFDIGEYYKAIVDALSWQGRPYVLPRDIAPIGLIYYNKRLFREAALDLPDGSWTWDFEPRPELGSKCFANCMQKLTKFRPDGGVEVWGYAPSWPGILADTFTYSMGARYVDDPQAFKKLTYDDPRVIKSYGLVAELANRRHWMPSPSDLTSVVQSTAVDLFIQQRVAMYQCGIWDVPHIRASMPPGSKNFFDWDITVAPGYRDPLTGVVTRAFPTGGSGYAIVSSTPHPKEAWELVRWMSGPPAMKAMARAGIAQPAIRKLALGPDWLPSASSPLDQQYPANRIATDQAAFDVVFPPTADYWPEIASLVNSRAEPIFLGAKSPEATLKEANALGQQRLDAILKGGELTRFNWWAGGVGFLAVLAALVAWVYLPERKRRLNVSQRKESRAAHLFLTPAIIGIFGLTIGPMILSLLMSLTEWDIITPAKWRGLDNYREALGTDPRFWNSVKVTLIYAGASVPLGLAFALALALLLNQKVRGIKLYRTCFYLPSLASVVASALLWMKVFQQEGGMLNSLLFGGKGPNWLGDEKFALPALVMMSIWGVGGATVILLAGLQGIPEFYYEAAMLDGAGPWRRFRTVTIPFLSPSLFFTLVTGVIGSLQAFSQPFIMTQGGPNDSTRFYMLHLYENAFGTLRMGYASALAWILFFGILGVTLLQFRLQRLVYYEGEAR